MLTLLHGDALTKLAEVESETVQTCVTSPPYFGLRDYGVAGQLGLERTPEEYVARLVEIFREVRRVLRKDGTVWLNLGDSYAGSGCGWGGGSISENGNQHAHVHGNGNPRKSKDQTPPPGLKAKDLIGVPWRVALALQADGWYIRSEITWCKRAAMPESVTDRPTTATEKIFLLTKTERYTYHQDAVRTPVSAVTIERYKSGWNGNEFRDHPSGHHNNLSKFMGTEKAAANAERGANLRNWWALNPEPFAPAHFATFPTEIPLRCILLGSKVGDTVLDPFAGSGTTGKVAIELGRKALLIELKAEYVEMIERRCKTTIGLPFGGEASELEMIAE